MKFLVDAQLPRRLAIWLCDGEPETLLLVATGNIGNRALEQLMQTHWLQIETSLQKHRFVELLRERLVVHD